MGRLKKHFDYKIGDSVMYHGPKHNRNSKIIFHGTGLITKDHIMERGSYKVGFALVPNREYCRTTFGYKTGGGIKRFKKKNLRTCRVLLVERTFLEW
jgi:hypothetical protein